MCIVLVALFAMVAVPAYGQVSSTNGQVSGTVTDQNGAVVPGARVTLTDTSTKGSQSTVTNETGRYIVLNVTAGVYNIVASKTGYSNAEVKGQTIEVGTTTTVNIALKVGASSTTVEVTATGTELQTMNSTVGNTISSLSLESLPTIGRDVSTFVTLQPGVSPDGSVAGAVVDQSSFMLDGGQNTNDMDGSMTVYTGSFAGSPTGMAAGGPSGVIPTNIDSIEEFKVNTANQTAEFGNSDGAQVNLVTKRGTSTWHGTAYEYYLDNNFNANNWNNNNAGVKLSSYHYSRYGGSFGGPIINKNILGGKTYFFGNYEAFRYPNSTTGNFNTPSANMRLGILTFGGVEYNLNPVTINDASGHPVAPAVCVAGACDPRGIGLNSYVKQLWTLMPASNTASTQCSRCGSDSGNVQDFFSSYGLPQHSDIGVGRVDHDFGSKEHFNSVYHYYSLAKTSAVQTDIGGTLPGDTFGQAAATGGRPQNAWSYVAGLTSNLTSNVTNEFHYSYLRNWWAWEDTGQSNKQIAALGGALEVGGESASALIPYNVNTQGVRTRYWNGHDNLFTDSVSVLKGNHFFQFGGQYQHNWDAHQRTDNGGGIDYQPVYQIGSSSSSGINGITGIYTPVGMASGFNTTWGRDYVAALGIVSQSQQVYTRSGPTLTLNPPLTPASDQSVIPYYNIYFSDSWRLKPNFTVTYGIGWTLEMPPVEANGKQVELVDQAGTLVSTQDYLNQRQSQALLGQVYNPTLGFTLVGNAENGRKYPYNPFYGQFSPRISFAWNPRFDSGSFLSKIFGQHDSVIRGGYNRIYGRLNGVDLVLVPLLGTGLMQAVTCAKPTTTGVCGTSATPVNAFRIGTDGTSAPLPAAAATLPQPDFPGLNAVPAGAGEALDPNFRPPSVDAVDLTIQRQFGSKITVEIGYIGRRIQHEFNPINLNAVPYMMTMGGQTFASAYASLEKSIGCETSLNACGATIPATVAAQPFFEAALGGSGSAYCTGYANCTTAVLQKESASGNLQCQCVWDLYSDLDNGAFVFPRSMMNTPLVPGNSGTIQFSSGVGVNASIGYANYNAGFIQVKSSDWHGLTAQSNFTWSKAMGLAAQVQASSELTADDAFNLAAGYGPQSFDRKYVYNLFFVYQPTWFKGKGGWQGRILDGWRFAPIFTAGSGLPLEVNDNSGDSQAYGAGDSGSFFNFNNASFAGAYTGGTSVNGLPASTQVAGVTLGGSFNGVGNLNMFSNPNAVWNEFRPEVLGLDTLNGGAGIVRGMPYWNMDFQLTKNVQIYERVSAEFQLVVTNFFNHVQMADPVLDITNPAGWGVSGGQGNTPRQFEFGFRIRF